MGKPLKTHFYLASKLKLETLTLNYKLQTNPYTKHSSNIQFVRYKTNFISKMENILILL